MNKKITSPAFFIGRGDEELISFGSGQPDMPPPQEAFNILKTFSAFKYGLIQGEESLRAALAEKYPKAHADQFVITNGASEAIDLVLRAISEPGASVLLPRPYYYSYPHNVRLAGMTPVYYDLVKGKIDFEQFKKNIKGCKAVLINSPSNPTGTVQEVGTLKKIEALCEKLGVYLLSDEVYKDIIYVRENYLLQGPHVATVNSFSKTYAMCGLRVGYLYTKDKRLLDAVVEMKTHTAMNTSIVGQMMALAALSSPPSYAAHNLDVWRERRDLIVSGMRELGLDLWSPEGAFYVFPKFKDSGRALSDLYHTYKIITYDCAWFGAPGRLRFSYALDIAKIQEGLRRIKKFLATEYRNY